MMDNLYYYNQSKCVPEEAKKTIVGGKLKGFTDINPMWRIKKLTELFGVCGIGWKLEVTKQECINGARGEVLAIVNINLYIRIDDAWSEPIFGTGGSLIVTTEHDKLVSNDEAFKMAYTDALSVACKQLGIGADVYWEKDGSKYDVDKPEAETKAKLEQKASDIITEADRTALKKIAKKQYGDDWKAKIASVFEQNEISDSTKMTVDEFNKVVAFIGEHK